MYKIKFDDLIINSNNKKVLKKSKGGKKQAKAIKKRCKK